MSLQEDGMFSIHIGGFDLHKRLEQIERKLDHIMAQDQDVLTAVTAVQTAVTQLTTDVTTGINDIIALLQQVNGNDPLIAQAITLANTVQASVQASDTALQAELANVPAPAIKKAS